MVGLSFAENGAANSYESPRASRIQLNGYQRIEKDDD
jgi:hypothetical protein